MCEAGTPLYLSKTEDGFSNPCLVMSGSSGFFILSRPL